MTKYLKLLTAALLLLPWASLKANGVGACSAAPLQGVWRVSSPYGMRVYPLSHSREWRMHWGCDLVCPRLSRVSAMHSGVVLFAGRWGCYGNVVILGNGNLITLYAHLAKFAPGLRRGMPVSAGEVIALSGDSGCVMGPHLHVECWVGKKRRRVNPLLVCAALRIPQKKAVAL